MKQKKGIRKKILFNTLIIVVILSATLVCTMSYFMGSLTDAILLSTLQPMAKTAAQNVESNLHMLADRLFLIRDNTVFIDEKATETDKHAVLERAKGGIEFGWLALYEPNGKLYTASGESPADISSDMIFKEMEATQNLVIDDTAINGNNLSLSVGTPILTSGETPEVVYYLVGSYKYDVISDVINNINVGTNGFAFIINKSGDMMAHRNTENVLNKVNFSTDFGTSEVSNSVLKQMVSGQTGANSITFNSNKQLISYSPVRGTHWSLAITAPRTDFMQDANRAVFTSIIITLVLLGLATLLTIKLTSQIQKPLGKVTARLATLSQGDLHSDVEISKTKDETESLSFALNQTVQNLNSYTSELSRVLAELSQSNLNVSATGNFHGDFVGMKDSLNQIINFLNEIMQELQDASLQVFTTSQMVAENANHIRKSSEEQSNHLTNLNMEAQAIGNNILDINTHTTDVNGLVEKAVNSITNGEEHMRDMLGAMEEININSLEIIKINKFLEDIAFQTNILALNAAVEAARAGAAGKGFAVVADEVRSLASKSTDSSQRTSAIITNTRKSVESGTAFANKTAVSMKEVDVIARDIANITQSLASAVDEQKISLDTMRSQVDTVSTLAENNLSSSLESATASQTLTTKADILQKLAAQFHLRSQNIIEGDKHE